MKEPATVGSETPVSWPEEARKAGVVVEQKVTLIGRFRRPAAANTLESYPWR